MPEGDQVTLYEAVGGDPTFRRLVDEFYRRVEADPALRPLFPADLGPGKEWQFLFLTQFWGGPRRYEAERGHPRLRMRHLPFTISPGAARRWLAHMLAALAAVGIAEPYAGEMRAYFEQTAAAMINAGATVAPAAAGHALPIERETPL